MVCTQKPEKAIKLVENDFSDPSSPIQLLHCPEKLPPYGPGFSLRVGEDTEDCKEKDEFLKI